MDRIEDDRQYDFIKKFIDCELNNDDIIFQDFNNSPYSETKIGSCYVDVDSITKFDHKSLLVMSFNIQSLAAKFNEFTDLISHLFLKNSSPDVICLQEIWQITDADLYEINGYQPIIFNARCNQRGGGVGIDRKSVV